MSEINMGTLYDYNKELSQKEALLDPILLNRYISYIVDWTKSNQYYMLLCREKNDYTVFNIINKKEESLKQDILETFQNRGRIVSINKTEDNSAWEIWIRNHGDYCYYFFNYTFGVVEIK